MQNQHATALQYQGTGFLLVGPPGSGKSSLAWALIAQGAQLVADDQVLLHHDAERDQWIATCPPALSGLLYLRDGGMQQVDALSETVLHLIFQSIQPAFDLSQPPALNLPVSRIDFIAPDAAEYIIAITQSS